MILTSYRAAPPRGMVYRNTWDRGLVFCPDFRRRLVLTFVSGFLAWFWGFLDRCERGAFFVFCVLCSEDLAATYSPTP